MRQRISIRGCVRPSIGPSVHSAFSQMTARRSLCQVSALFFKTAKTLVCQFIEIFCFLSKKRIFRMTLNHFWDHLKWWSDNVCLEKNWLGILESNKLSRGKKRFAISKTKRHLWANFYEILPLSELLKYDIKKPYQPK